MSMLYTFFDDSCKYQQFLSYPQKWQFQIRHPYTGAESTGCLVYIKSCLMMFNGVMIFAGGHLLLWKGSPGWCMRKEAAKRWNCGWWPWLGGWNCPVDRQVEVFWRCSLVGSMLLVPQQLFPELELFFVGFKITVLSTFLVNKKSWICYDLLKTILLLGNPLLWESIPMTDPWCWYIC